MERIDLEPKVREALDRLHSRDAFLLRVKGSEWAIAHRLAVYLEPLLSEWDIDCEYNRQGERGDIKRFVPEKTVRPDIIVHHRGKVELHHNLLVIEMKKSDSQPDYAKVSEYTAVPRGKRKFQYMYGIALDLSASPPMTWFTSGNQIV